MLNDIKEIIAETKSHLRPLGTKNAYSYSTALYFKHYGLDLIDQNTEHFFGTFQSGSFILAGHIFIPLETGRSQVVKPKASSLTGFKPVNYKATVVIMHGYLNHCGLLSKIIKYLIEAGFAVAVFDLPGHGLSSGEPTAIEDFSQYSDSLNDFMNIVKPVLHGPYHIIGHSTGAAIIMDYLLGGSDDCFDKVILAAPLERSDWWLLSKISFSIGRHFCSNLPRVFSNVSSDKDFLQFVKYKDPLQAKKVSMNWVNAMFKWDEKITNAKTSRRPTLVVQGSKDNIIDWRFNIRFILSKFKNSRIELIENCRHELFNESADIRKEVFSQIRSYLEN
jgi:alpha-beta hydrolase superfamily lysophospholipase